MARPLDQLPYVEWESDSGATERLYSDNWEREEFGASAAVTAIPVEDGSIMSDHFVLDPVTQKMSMFFSGSPIRGDLDPNHKGAPRESKLTIPEYPPDISLTGLVKLLPFVPRETVANTVRALGFDADPGSRLKESLVRLLELRAARKLVNVGTSVLRLENMAITQIGLGRSADDGDSGVIELSLQQVEFVRSDVGQKLPLPLEPRAQAKTSANAGGDTPVPTGPKQTAARALHALVSP